jgi:hypothetical protein
MEEEMLVFYVEFNVQFRMLENGEFMKEIDGPFPTVDMLLANHDDVILTDEQKIELAEGNTVCDYADVEKTILYASVYSEVARCKR